MFAGLSTLVPLAGSVVLFGLGAAAFGVVTVRAPAFNESLQVETITGNQRLTNLEAMYDPAAYLYQVGYGYLVSDGLDFVELQSFEEAEAHQQLAETYLRESLARDPANGFAWVAYGEALAGRGEVQGATTALQRSKALAPTRGPIALSRLYLVATLRGLTGDPEAFSELVEEDLTVLTALQPDQAALVARDLEQAGTEADGTASPSRTVLPRELEEAASESLAGTGTTPDTGLPEAPNQDGSIAGLPPLAPLDPEIQQWLDEGGAEAEATPVEN